MGLFEKAIQFKKDLNHRGVKTVMDNIIGPAETNMLKDGQTAEVSDSIIYFINRKDLVAVEENISQVESTPNDNSQLDEIKDILKDKMETFEDDILNLPKEENVLSISIEDLNAIELEIMRSSSFVESCDALLFNIMGQVGVNSSSLLTKRVDSDKWVITYSKGISLSDDEVEFSEENRFISRALSSEKIIDITEFRDDSLYLDYYADFVSVDARYLFRITYNEEPFAILFLGDKVTIEDYLPEDKALIKELCAFTSKFFWQFIEKKRLDNEISELKRSIISNNILEKFQDKILNSDSLDVVDHIVFEEFEKHGIMSYAVFAKTKKDAEFNLILSEHEDFLRLKEKKIKINYLNPIVKVIQAKNSVYVQMQPESDELLVNCFGKDIVKLMTQFKAYPYILCGKIEGFICIFKQSQKSSLIEDRIIKTSKFLIGVVISILEAESAKSKFVDDFEIIHKRISDDILKCETLSIPLCLVLCSIKNHKSFFTSLGYEKTKTVLKNLEKIIEVRLSDGDYSIRYARNKFLIVLPGKDKQYGVHLSNILKNKFQKVSEDSSFELTLSFLTAEYPRDGATLYYLLDKIE